MSLFSPTLQDPLVACRPFFSPEIVPACHRPLRSTPLALPFLLLLFLSLSTDPYDLLVPLSHFSSVLNRIFLLRSNILYPLEICETLWNTSKYTRLGVSD
ncbi:hypothetical protein BJX96DRAFT_48699 [Aspergillus floccosus]